MITYDHLWWIKSTYDGWRRLKTILGLFWAVRASQPTKKSENKTPCMFFHCAFDGNAPGRRHIIQKSKHNEKLNLLKSNLWKSKISSGSMPRCIFWRQQPPKHPQNTPKHRFSQAFLKFWFFNFIQIYIEMAPGPFC